jgi:hypothetical protein
MSFLLTILALICVKRKESQHTITYRPKYGQENITTSKDVDKMYVILPFENIL